MNLNPGDENVNVKRLQIKLGLPPVGKYGPKTEAAIKELQINEGLPVTGIVDKTVWSILFPNDNIDLLKLVGVIPDRVIDELPYVMSKYSINTVLRLSHFLSQCSHESTKFTKTVENLNYSRVGLLKTFPKYFNNGNVDRYVRNPQKIASFVYANRMGNGSESSGEGFKYRGRGYLQCTGKETYRKLSNEFDIDAINEPELISTTYPLASAGWFFKNKGVILKCDKGANNATISDVTISVNGGLNGLSDRIIEFNKFFKILK